MRKIILCSLAAAAFAAPLAAPADFGGSLAFVRSSWGAEPPAIEQQATAAANTVTKPTVLDLGKKGKFRVTNATLNGQPAVRLTRITKRAHASAAYLHVSNALTYCQAWNDQSARDNIRYVQAANGWPAYTIGLRYVQYTRYSNTQLQTWVEWFENSPSVPRLAIHYACLMQGDDSNIIMQSVAGTSVYWSYYNG